MEKLDSLNFFLNPYISVEQRELINALADEFRTQPSPT